MKSFMKSIGAFCEVVLSVFGYEDENKETETKEPAKKRSPDMTKLTRVDKVTIFQKMEEREQQNANITRNNIHYVTLEEITRELNFLLNLSKSRQFYSAIYKEMSQLQSAGIDPFVDKKAK